LTKSLSSKAKLLTGVALLFGATLVHADPTLVIQSWDRQVLGGGRGKATLDGDPIYVYCIDFAHSFAFNTAYTVNVTPLYDPNFANKTRYGNVPDNGWYYANNTYTALQRYMMAAWLTTQYAPYFADWGNSVSQFQAKGIQSAIWILLDPQGSPWPPTGGNYNDWLTAATNIITQPDYDDPGDPFYRYFRVISPQELNSDRPQEFIVVVTPEPAAILLLGSVLLLIGRRLRAKA
jgi:hypothetical protein